MNNKFIGAWGKDTCYPPLKDKWTEECPELGQCAVTALLIQEEYGGDIVFNKEYNHYWNRLSSLTEVDLTKSQFPGVGKIGIDKIVDRKSFGEDVIQRYKILKERISESRSKKSNI